MFYVYMITNKINGKIYVGKSSGQTKDRWEIHLKIAKGGKKKYPRLFFAVHAAIRKYKSENFSFEILKKYSNEYDAFAAESIIIHKLRDEGTILYNLTDGGEGPAGAKRSKESRERMSVAHRKESGMMSGKQKLTADQVRQIKLLLTENKIKMKDIGNMFSVDFRVISNINRGKTWAWLEVPGFVPAKRIPNRKLTEHDVQNIRMLLNQKATYREVASMFEVSVACIQKIKNLQTFIGI